LEDLADDLLHWRRVAAAAVAAVEGRAAVSGRRLDQLSASVAAAVSAAEMADGLVAEVVGEMERSRREAEEANAGLRFRAASVERSMASVPVVKGRAGSARLLQLAESGNAAAGQAAGRLDGCRLRCRAVTDRVQRSTAMEDALVANVAEHEALGRARQARNRGASHLTGLRSSSRVARARDDARERTEGAATRLTGQADALRVYDRPAGTAR
jgi:hypothetical protein